MTRRGRHVQAVVPSLWRDLRCRPWNCAATRLTMRHPRPRRRLSILHWARWARLEASHLEPVGVAKRREAAEAAEAVEEEGAEAAEVAAAAEEAAAEE
jgi:hypothetical protein